MKVRCNNNYVGVMFNWINDNCNNNNPTLRTHVLPKISLVLFMMI